MPYSTGTVTTPTALKTALEIFATTNGWTLSGSDYLYKGGSFVKLTVPTGPSTEILQIVGALTDSGGTPSPYIKGICIPVASWPVTYHFFCNTSPDEITCILNYDTSKYQKIAFGDIVKVHSSAFTGGNFYFASKSTLTTAENFGLYITDSTFAAASSGSSAELFAFKSYIVGSTPIYMDIDSYGWNQNGNEQNKISLSSQGVNCIFRSPNSWNSQSHLVPINIEYLAPSGYLMPLGHVAHTRLFRMDNYEAGEIITLGSDKWKVFPSYEKRSGDRNGGINGNFDVATGTGTLGVAIRYDGP